MSGERLILPGARPVYPLAAGTYDDAANASFTTQVIIANTLYALPFVPRGQFAGQASYDRIGVEITTAATAGKKLRLGLYAYGADRKPGALILDAGELAADAVAGVEATIALALAVGIPVFRALISDGTPTLRAESTGGNRVGNASLTDIALRCSWTASLAYTAGVTTLPDPFPAAPGVSGVCSNVRLRVA